jgi:pimeloyl-ACP methyl ester carboxylesterase
MKLVLLPGMDGTGDLFAPFIEALGDDIKVDVVRYPHEGGQSYAEFTARVLPSLPSEPYVLLAESFSGPIALAVAATAPQNLCGLILLT